MIAIKILREKKAARKVPTRAAPTFSGAGMLLSAAAAIAGVSVGTILLAVGAAIVAGITIYTIIIE